MSFLSLSFLYFNDKCNYLFTSFLLQAAMVLKSSALIELVRKHGSLEAIPGEYSIKRAYTYIKN